MATPPALVPTDWLARHLSDPDVRILDASYFVPGGIAPARAQYDAGHIPGAIFFDVNAVADATKPKEHAFPDAQTFAARVGALGIGNDHHVVAYDHMGGTLAAARVWFMFRAFGHARGSVLDGGRTKWAAEHRAFTTDVLKLAPCNYSAARAGSPPRTRAEMRENIAARTFQVLDARGKGRFEGTEPEPRPGLRSGHIPGSRNLPFLRLIDPATQVWKSPEALAGEFAAAQVDLGKPLVATCGSGITACALALGAHLAGKDDTLIYDGSWVEWGADESLPLETGPANENSVGWRK